MTHYYYGNGYGYRITPSFVDIDDDRDYDLFSGEIGGDFLFFRNINF